MSQALRKLTANIKRANTLVIFINQIRMKIGVMFGNRRRPPAAMRSSSRCASISAGWRDQEGRGSHRQRDARQGREEQIAPPPREACSTSSTARHPRHGEIIELGVANDIIDKSGAVPTTARRSARARTTRANSCVSIRRWRTRSKPRFAARRRRGPVRCVRAANRPRSNPRHSDRTARRDRRVRKNARARAVAGSHAATTRSELREKLIATGASRDEADAVLDEIAGLGYLRRASRMRWSARRPVR